MIHHLYDIQTIGTAFFQAREAYDGSTMTKILEPEDIARAVIFATTQPKYSSVNEILIEPREAPIWGFLPECNTVCVLFKLK